MITKYSRTNCFALGLALCVMVGPTDAFATPKYSGACVQLGKAGGPLASIKFQILEFSRDFLIKGCDYNICCSQKFADWRNGLYQNRPCPRPAGSEDQCKVDIFMEDVLPFLSNIQVAARSVRAIVVLEGDRQVFEEQFQRAHARLYEDPQYGRQFAAKSVLHHIISEIPDTRTSRSIERTLIKLRDSVVSKGYLKESQLAQLETVLYAVFSPDKAAAEYTSAVAANDTAESLRKLNCKYDVP